MKTRINYKILNTHNPKEEDKFISAISKYPDGCDVMVFNAFDCNPQFKILELNREEVPDSFSNGLYPYSLPEKVVVGMVSENSFADVAPRILFEPNKN